MRTEVPVLRRCCFCLPLRRGLIAWGYLKLSIAWMLLIYFVSVLIPVAISAFHFQRMYHFINLLIIFIIVALVAADVILHSIFVFGAHKKKMELLRMYYIYSIILLVLTCLLGLIYIGFMIDSCWEDVSNYYRFVAVFAVTILLSHLFIHGYVIILVRSLMTKLTDLGSFSFINHATGSVCTLRLKDPSEVQFV